ncbi:unnamed protein product [Ceutorhynchus assimilis]|uniref:endo-polygalacturonase n=1 Tax=Ceutorhynchus assimilis TaxID=467358 RepID=A0A9N9QNJ3_9CUCU|nr:unnamed protein product [Ceutorhynchus assimilis]
MKLFIVTFLASIAAIQASPLKASCTVASYSALAAALKSCSALVIKDLTVPAKTTLQLNLKNGASLTFAGTIRWNYTEWQGPLIEIKGSKVTVNGAVATLDGQGKNTGFRLSKGHNTDGFDVSSSTGITVQNSVVKNQDDCVAVNQGSNYIFQNLTCSGGHGLSLSVGQTSASGSANIVKNVTFSDCTVTNSDNGIHVKSHSDAGAGSVSDVTYKNIKLSGIRKYGISVQEDYEKGNSTGTPKANIPITKLTLSNVKGTMSGGMGVYILCTSGGCSNWPWSGVSITSGKKSNYCTFTPSGFSC